LRLALAINGFLSEWRRAINKVSIFKLTCNYLFELNPFKDHTIPTLTNKKYYKLVWVNPAC
jgi:hypothetical protein